MDPNTGCPANYTELFSEYFPMMRSVVARAGIASEDVEDVAMDILARFIEKDGIGYYDPDRLHDVGENPDLPGARFRKAKFKGMLRGFTATYVLSYRDKQMVRHRREPWRLEYEAPHQRSSGIEEQTSWLDSDEYTVDPLGDTEVSVCIVRALQQARADLILKSTARRDYAALVDMAVRHGLLDGKIDRASMREEMRVSSATLTAMLKEMRAVIRPLLTEVGVLRDVVA